MSRALRRTIAIVACAALAASGCATAGTTRIVPPRVNGSRVADRAVLVEYVQRLPVGTSVRIERAHGRPLRGTLMKATDRSLIVQPRTRIPEAALEVPLDEVLSVAPEPEGGANIGKAIGVGAAAGAGAALAVFLIILAAFAD